MQEGRGASLSRLGRARLLLSVTLAAVLVIDRVSKLLAVGALSDGRRIRIIGSALGLRLVHNPGGIFGILPGSTQFIFFAGAIIIAVVATWAWHRGMTPVIMGFIIGGGVGNLIDRLLGPVMFRGEVVDFIDSSVWPTFNLADVAIVVGVGLFLVKGFKARDHAV